MGEVYRARDAKLDRDRRPHAGAGSHGRARARPDAATLLADFWNTVDAVLRERGVIP